MNLSPDQPIDRDKFNFLNCSSFRLIEYLDDVKYVQYTYLDRKYYKSRLVISYSRIILIFILNIFTGPPLMRSRYLLSEFKIIWTRLIWFTRLPEIVKSHINILQHNIFSSAQKPELMNEDIKSVQRNWNVHMNCQAPIQVIWIAMLGHYKVLSSIANCKTATPIKSYFLPNFDPSLGALVGCWIL